MTRLLTKNNAIQVTRDARGKIRTFTWCGRTHTVQKVREQWQVDTDWWSEEGRVHRECLKLTTTDGMLCEVYLDLLDDSPSEEGAWYISKCYD